LIEEIAVEAAGAELGGRARLEGDRVEYLPLVEATD